MQNYSKGIAPSSSSVLDRHEQLRQSIPAALRPSSKGVSVDASGSIAESLPCAELGWYAKSMQNACGGQPGHCFLVVDSLRWSSSGKSGAVLDESLAQAVGRSL